MILVTNAIRFRKPSYPMPDQPSYNVGDWLRRYASLERKTVFPTGIKRLDKYVKIVPASVNIIGARMSMGKTALALYMARRMAEQGIRVMFVSVEMTGFELSERLTAQWTSRTSDELERDREAKRLVEKVKPLADRADQVLRFHLRDDLAGTVNDIRKILTELRSSNDPEPNVIYIDHLQHCWFPEGTTTADAYHGYMRDLKHLAKEHELAIILCSQLNRAVYESKDKQGKLSPQAQHAKGSGGVEEVADTFLACWQPNTDEDNWVFEDQATEREFIVRVVKNRNGPRGEVTLRFTPAHYSFEEPETHWPKERAGGDTEGRALGDVIKDASDA